MKKKNSLTLLALLIICSIINPALARPQTPPDCSSSPDLSAWLNCRVEALAKARINQTNNTNQAESPSIAGSTTSLVDQSSASDLFSAALNLAGIGGSSGEMENPSFTATASLYSIYAAAIRRDPLAPDLYSRNQNLRRFSFTLGQELDEDNQNQRAAIAGFKVLIINDRDATSNRNVKQVDAVRAAISGSSQNFANIAALIQDKLFEFQKTGNETKADFIRRLQANFTSIFSSLTPEQVSALDEIIEEKIAVEAQLLQTIRDAAMNMRKGAQLAFSFNSKLREEDGTDEYRTELTFDYGIFDRVNVSLNGSFDYKDSKIIGGDKRGGRFAAEGQFQLSKENVLAPFGMLERRGPLVLSFAYEGNWMTDTDATHKAQGKLTIPIASGINFPISVTWANKTDLIDESTVKGRFGFTFDLAKLAGAFK